MKPRHDGFLASRRKKNDRLNEVGKQHESINNTAKPTKGLDSIIMF
jgi:hypothetical protein